METVSVFLPTRKGSERVANKNTRIFAGFPNGLLEVKLNQLIKTKRIDEIVLSSNDEASLDYGKKIAKQESRLKIIERPDDLALSSTNLIDLVNYVPSICTMSHILWTHVTSPFVMGEDYDNAVKTYFQTLNEGYDSLMSVKTIQNFLWSKEKNDLINRLTDIKWPRTQDLMPLYEIDSAFFIASKNVYLNNKDRIGVKPFLMEQSGHKSFDVDWEDDFELAELIYKHSNG
ncbi:N-acylneuraminate cytidylyltransferase [Flavobacterium aquidurense]|uniref:Acylneuraminate cytidylyltransferase n=1 Tax=Flavobacterium frigidimaris TaxID=262320 RepID=A0ABX4BMJ9_FLAFR|nr:acylneuraminate cytidylyltransferase [Flavobacterium frigidimaris]OXA77564.1 acylneuraminate cytidylyltransferase [Flavobacterium frigidimaris]SDY89737.1 N-acylneuraminate cytidylyltransferase [Flavobacterium aquidurense]